MARRDPSTAVRREGQSGSGSVARGAVALLSTQPLTWAATLLLTVFLPKYLGDQGLGQYTVAMTIAGLGGTIGLFGMSDWMMRSAAAETDRTRGHAAAAVVLVAMVSLLTAVVTATALSVLGVPIAHSGLLLVVLLLMVSGNVQATLLARFIGQERHGRYAWLNATNATLIACAGLAILMAGADVVGYAVAGLVVSVIFTAFVWWASGIHISRATLTSARLRQAAGAGLPFLGWRLAGSVRVHVGILLLAALLQEQAVGWWAAAGRITSISVFIPNVIVTPLLPALSRQAHDAPAFQRLVQRSLVTVLLLTVPVNAMILALAPAVPDLLGWGPSFLPVVPLIMVLAVLQPLVAASMVLGTALIALHHERQWLRIAVTATVIKPGLYLGLIPAFAAGLQHGAIGAAVAEVIVESFVVCGALILLPRRLLGPSTALSILGIMLAAIAQVSFVLLLSPVSPLLAVPAGSLAFLGVALMTRVVTLKELTQASGMLLKRN